jgi:hypothetical protein
MGVQATSELPIAVHLLVNEHLPAMRASSMGGTAAVVDDPTTQQLAGEACTSMEKLVPTRAGGYAHPPTAGRWGTSPEGVRPDGEAVVTCCGLVTARSQEQSRVPHGVFGG